MVTHAKALVMTDGADVFVGRKCADVVSGGAGDDLLTGADGNDRRMGDAADDVLTPGAGSDHADGGTGSDRIVLSGRAAEYRVVLEGAGHRLTGRDGSDFILNTETFGFAYGTRMLAEMLRPGSGGSLRDAFDLDLAAVAARPLGKLFDGAKVVTEAGAAALGYVRDLYETSPPPALRLKSLALIASAADLVLACRAAGIGHDGETGQTDLIRPARTPPAAAQAPCADPASAARVV